MIALKNITKIYRYKNRETKALDNVSLTVPAGKIFGVIGTSGAGKSTLIRCVNLLEKPDSGDVVVDGRQLLELSASELNKARRQIGMIFQHFNLLSSRTVFGNIALPLELIGTPVSEIKEKISVLLKLVGLQGRQDDYLYSLSGGQKQRVAIARALASDPKILLCDEATSALDPATTRSILELLKDINKRLNITILLITHEMDIVKSICDEVAIISEGQLVEQGIVSDLFSHPQTSLAKQFIASALHVEIPAEYRQRLSTDAKPDKHPLLKLEFSGRSADIPILSIISRKYAVDFQIVSSQLDYAGGVKFGVMLVELIGADAGWDDIVHYFQNNDVNVTHLGYV